MRHSRKYMWKKPRGLPSWGSQSRRRSRNLHRQRGGLRLRRNIDPTLLIALNNRYRRNIDPTRLTALRHRRHNTSATSSWLDLDLTRLTALRSRRHNLDPTRLTALRSRRHNLDPTRLVAYKRNPCSSSHKRKPYRRNPDPAGNPWGPKLYNPLTDSTNKFKNERHYTKMISKLRRNPW